MPFEKSKMRRGNAKQKKRMVSRLMAITLKADDYIYNNKPIKMQEAQAYAQEMASYRAHCEDERYLQVIEKLTSYMKCIINEETTKNTTEGQTNSSRIGQSYIDNENVENSDSIDIEMERSISNLCIVDPLNIPNSSTNSNINVTALTEGNLTDIANHNVFAHKTVMDAIENNSTVVEDVSNLNDDTGEQSQNILSNIEHANYMSLDVLQNNTNTKNYRKKQLPVTFNIEDKTNFNQQNVTKNTQGQAKMTPKLKMQTKIVPKPKRGNKIKNNNANFKKQRNKVNAHNKISDTLSTQNDSNKKEVFAPIQGASHNTALVKNKRSKKNKMLDLSWVEDIKFLREIDREEIIKLDNLPESFWSDLSLPPNVNNSDFDYDNINVWKNSF